ncbi:RNA12 protein-domain-containing protein [Chytriomyces sp. MP71]|nr:RNA12 protein-domain-containing protein [Chytriomyces sp. MP71]
MLSRIVFDPMRRAALFRLQGRPYSSAGSSASEPLAVWFQNIYPIKLSRFDPRHLWAQRYAFLLKENAKKDIIPPPEAFKGKFTYINSVSSIKEGGLLIRFNYDGDKQEAFDTISQFVAQKDLRSLVTFGQRIKAYPVQGVPWIEDLHSSIPSTRVNLEFRGPELPLEVLYKEFRVFGSMFQIAVDPIGPNKDAPRRGHVQFYSIRSATAARICLNGKVIDGTKVSIAYEPALSRNVLTNWIRDHPRISAPVILAVLSFAAFLIFDPMRVFFITNTVTQRFSITHYIADFGESLKRAVGAFFFGNAISSDDDDDEDNDDSKQHDMTASFTERKIHENNLLVYLREAPDTAMLIHGSKGTKSTELVEKCTRTEPYVLHIRLDELVNANDHIMLNRIAAQFGCFPMFNWMVSSGAMIDTLITAATGAKAGFSSTSEAQVKQVFEYATAAFNNIVTHELKKHQHLVDLQSHLDVPDYSKIPEVQYPVVVIDGYLTNEKARQSFLYESLTEWAATLVEVHAAHVVFLSDNPGAVKYLGRAFPNKTVETILLKDASHESSISYAYRRLGLPNSQPLPEELEHSVKALGGRLTDLEQLLQKIKASLKAQHSAKHTEHTTLLGKKKGIEDAVQNATPQELADATVKAFQDMIIRSETEIRKNGLFEDVGNSASTKTTKEWTTVQFWKIITLLTKYEEISYDDLRYHALFKGDESAIQAIERAGLISVGLKNGRPFSIKPGRPIYRSAFVHLQSDQKYSAIMGLKTVKTLAADELVKISALESEMSTITSKSDSRLGWWAQGEVRKRVDFLAKLIGESHRKLASLDAEERKLKKHLQLAE